MKRLALVGIELLDLKLNSYQFIMEEGEASQFNLMMEIIYIFSLISAPSAPINTRFISWCR